MNPPQTHQLPITLINPKGERKDLSFVGFYELKIEFTKSTLFKQWEAENGMLAWYHHEGKLHLNSEVVNAFLIQKGYQIIDNDIFNRKEK